MCFLKEKTAYELGMSDWSADVCSSDLSCIAGPEKPRPENHEPPKIGIPKRKKAGLDTRLSCKTDYFITADQPNVSATSGFFTGDYLPLCDAASPNPSISGCSSVS